MTKYYFDIEWRSPEPEKKWGYYADTSGDIIGEILKSDEGWSWAYYGGAFVQASMCKDIDAAILNIKTRLQRDGYVMAPEKFRPMS